MARDVAGRFAHGRQWTLATLFAVAWAAAPCVAAAEKATGQTQATQRVFGNALNTAAMADAAKAKACSVGSECESSVSASGANAVWFKYDGTSEYGSVLTVVTDQADSEFELRAYTLTGQPLVATASSGSLPELFVRAEAAAKGDTPAARGFVEVRLVAAGDATARGFTLTVRDVTASDHWRGQGHTQRVALSPADYSALARFGRCDSADPDAGCLGPAATSAESCDKACVDTVHAIAGRMVDRTETEREPVIAFIGLEGIDRMVLVDGTANDRVPPHHRSLDKVRDFWVVYVENDAAPFTTSIDVEFKARAAARDFEEFDPAGLTARRAVGTSGYRVVEVGVRRFRMRPPPVAMEVTISRRGPGYGLRQWRNTYRVRGWTTVQIGGGLFIPAKAVDVDRHELPDLVPPDGSLPTELVLVKEQARRPVFLTASLSLPQRRTRVDNAIGRWAEYGWRAIPEVVVGVGLPPTRSKAWYLGGSWPVGWDRVSLTMGTLLIRQNKLRPGNRVGDRQPFGTQIESLTYDKWVATFTLGVTMELTRSQ